MTYDIYTVSYGLCKYNMCVLYMYYKLTIHIIYQHNLYNKTASVFATSTNVCKCYVSKNNNSWSTNNSLSIIINEKQTQ